MSVWVVVCVLPVVISNRNPQGSLTLGTIPPEARIRLLRRSEGAETSDL